LKKIDETALYFRGVMAVIYAGAGGGIVNWNCRDLGDFGGVFGRWVVVFGLKMVVGGVICSVWVR
jgi:hypothetical protein